TPNLADGSFTYLPNPDYTGPDTFTYHVHDATAGNSNTAMVTITVRAAGASPAVINDNYTTDEGTPLTTTALDGVLGNDTGTPTVTAAVVSGPLFGTLTFFGTDGSFIYAPSVNFSGLDSFVYIAKDGAGNTSLGMATINVRATPAITWADPADITYGTALGVTQLNASADVDGTFVYTPAAGTLLNAGNGQNLKVDFTPTDTVNYSTASKTVHINVMLATPTITFGAAPTPTYLGGNFTM